MGPTVVAITGSYGKTTTKGYVAHLAGATRSVLATPRSYNNSAGLARSINEQLAAGTEVFVAEMGTYGPGEIADMCRWVKPAISVITAIGPVHLERMGSEAAIAEAKSEIFSTARTAIVNVDSEWLSPIADRLKEEGRSVVRCSSRDPGADVCAQAVGDGLVVTARGEQIARVERPDVAAGNVACAVAVALELGTPPATIAGLLPTLPTPPNRLTAGTGTTGATIIDDTYNANPAGCAAALAAVERHADGAQRVVIVTPGMVELGRRQREENARFAAAAAKVATDVVLVGLTNRGALLQGVKEAGTGARVHLMDDRSQAAAWVKDNVGPGDVVLYENDLPDHFP